MSMNKIIEYVTLILSNMQNLDMEVKAIYVINFKSNATIN